MMSFGLGAETNQGFEMEVRSPLRVSLAILGGLLLADPAPVFAEEPGLVEMRIAEQHAAAAGGASNFEQARSELQQALNCLVGREGREFVANAGDPCKGAGALPNLSNGSVNRIRVQKAIRLANVGVTFHDFKPAHFTARAVQAVLEEGTR
jgi:hypothetical protein